MEARRDHVQAPTPLVLYLGLAGGSSGSGGGALELAMTFLALSRPTATTTPWGTQAATRSSVSALWHSNKSLFASKTHLLIYMTGT